jgi:hypothetical protein
MVDTWTEEVAKGAIAALVLQQAKTVARVHPHFHQTHHHPEECYTPRSPTGGSGAGVYPRRRISGHFGCNVSLNSA